MQLALCLMGCEHRLRTVQHMRMARSQKNVVLSLGAQEPGRGG
jgi:hypothetical protein